MGEGEYEKTLEMVLYGDRKKLLIRKEEIERLHKKEFEENDKNLEK